MVILMAGFHLWREDSSANIRGLDMNNNEQLNNLKHNIGSIKNSKA